MGWFNKTFRGQPPRQLDDDDITSWLNAASDREAKPPRDCDRDTLRAYLKAKNPVRWRRLQADYRWACKHTAKLGMNPEDTRWLL